MGEVSARRRVSIICPIFNEEACIPLFHQRLSAALAFLQDRYDFELLFTNNCSTDGSADAVKALRKADPRVQLLTFSRNVGYQASVLAGLKQARGDALVVIDVDCEDPPELIPMLLAGWEEGHDVVYGLRGRRAEPWLVTLARRIFYRLNRLVADSDIILDMAEFMLMTAAVRDAVVANRSTYPFIRAEIAAAGFSRKGVAYDRGPRVAGQTHYNLWGMTRFAVAGILSSSTFPLRLLLYLLPLLYVANAALLGVMFYAPAPWVTPALVALDGLYLSTAVAVVGLYLARTYRNGVGRPLAVVDWDRSEVDAAARQSPNTLPRSAPP